MAWSDDAAIDVDDLSQIARIELLRSLGSYRYASRFSTWVTQVVIRSVRCAIRDGRALKRHGRSLSLDQPGVPDAAISVAEAPDSVSGANLLAEQIDTVLSQSADARLARIFRLWAVADLSTAEIGALVKLHPSRVRALLLQARLALRQHPEIQTWQEHDEYLHL
jgi:RNA polymerase sigma factor (sigma-70 family)